MAHGNVAYQSHRTSTDAAMVDITVRINTNKWSSRKKNIVMNCIDTGLITCGLKTADMIYDVMEAYDIPVRFKRTWSYDGDKNYIIVHDDNIKPERLSELKAIVAARCKMNYVNDRAGYDEHQFLRVVEDPERWGTHWMAGRIPFYNDMNLNDWAVEDDDASRSRKNKLIEMIRYGQIITATYKPEGV